MTEDTVPAPVDGLARLGLPLSDLERSTPEGRLLALMDERPVG